MSNFILTAIYFALPAIFANSAPVFVKSISFLNKPIDGGRKWHGKPILGSHKTWRGLFFAIVAGIIIVYIQRIFYQYEVFRQVSYIDYQKESVILVGFLVGFGAIFGDAVKSFIKRRVGIKSGDRFFPWDQLDSLIGAGLFISLIKPLTWQMWLFFVGFALIVHPLANFMAYKTGVKEVPW